MFYKILVLPARWPNAPRGPKQTDRRVQLGRQREIRLHAFHSRRRARDQPYLGRRGHHIRLGLEPADGLASYGPSASYWTDETGIVSYRKDLCL